MKHWLKAYLTALMATLMSIIYAIPAMAQTSPPTGDSGIGWTAILIAAAAVLVLILLIFLGRKKK